MRRLTAIDAQFLYTEEYRPAALQHTLKVSIIGPNPDVPYSFDATKASLRERLPLLPPFRWRLVRTPMDLHHPVWIDDPDFDLDFHVRRVGCPVPGGRRELCELIGDIAGRPLDRSKPLWELYVVEGLADGGIALVVKMHHSLADGVASSQLLDLVYDTTPEPKPLPPDLWQPEKVPGRLRMLGLGLVDLVKNMATGLPSAARTTYRAARQKRVDGLSTALPPKMFDAAPQAWNGLLTPHRRFTTVSVPLDDIKEIRAAFGTTINDVVLAMCAGGLRRNLLRHGHDVSGPLVGSVPVSTRQEGERPAWGNHLAKIFVRLPVDVEDPVQRLHDAREYANDAKSDLARTLGGRLENWIEHMPVPVLKGVFLLLLSQIKAGKATENLVVSNVPGPRQKLYINGSEVTTFFSMGPLAESVGLNITAWSYVDELNVCLLACREMVPDLWELTDDLHAAYTELLAIARDRTPASA